MSQADQRLSRERATISVMIRMHCRDRHYPADLLYPACAELEAYALQRVERCPYGSRKPPCAKCPIHCYTPAMRGQVREVMRYAGPRMLLRHPVLAVLHLLDGMRPIPGRP
jgi:hypothetical protein